MKRKISKSESKAKKHQKQIDQVDGIEIATYHKNEYGMAPCLLHPGKKKPREKGWPKLSYTAKEIEQDFNSGHNVGIMLGRPSNGIIDFDIDTDDALRPAEYYLPEDTFIYGREGREGSHYLFRIVNNEAPNKATYKHKIKDETLLEFRSTGGQSVLPGSYAIDKHGVGFWYSVENDVEPLELTLAQAEHYAKGLCLLTVLVREYPTHERHDYCCAIAGVLALNGWTGEELEEWFGAFFGLIADLDEEVKSDRMGAVKNTIKSAMEDGQVFGWPTLEPYLPDGATRAACAKWIGVGEKPKVTEVDDDPQEIKTIDELEALSAKARVLGDDREIMTIPDDIFEELATYPLIKGIMDYTLASSYRPNPTVALSVALTCVATLSQNSFLVEHFNTPLSPYFLLLGATSTGKDSVEKAVNDICDAARLPDDGIHRPPQSSNALWQRLNASPHLTVIHDELSTYLEVNKRNAIAQGIFNTYTDLFAKGDSIIKPQEGMKATIQKVNNPFFIFYGIGQPEIFVQSIQKNHLTSGLLNRFILFDLGSSKSERRHRDEAILREPSRKLQGKLRTFCRDAQNNFMKDKEFIPFTKGARQVFYDFEDWCSEQGEEGELIQQLYARGAQLALMIAGILALAKDHESPIISKRVMVLATKILKVSMYNADIRFVENVADNDFEALNNRIKKILRSPIKFSTRKSLTNTQRTHLKRGVVSRSALARLIGGSITVRQLDMALETLLEAEHIRACEMSTKTNKMMTYIWRG